MPKHAHRPVALAAGLPIPRASTLALARQRQRERQRTSPHPTSGPSRLTLHRSIARPAIVAIVSGALLLGAIGVTPVAAAQRQTRADPNVPVFDAAAEPSPSPTPKPTPTPWPTPKGVKGLDVSHWNDYPDFTKLRAKGMRFVISKATQGTAFVDDTYQRHTRDARAAGMLPGAYHFFDYNKNGVAQAKHFLDTVRDSTGLGALLPLVVDVETLGSLGKPNKTKARQRLHALLDELYRQTGRYPMIYTSRHMWGKVVGSPGSFGEYPLWVACWKCDEIYLPNGWSDWDLWQVGQFKFPGSTKLDGNVYRRSMDRLRGERQRSMQIDDGAIWAADQQVVADLRGYHGTNVRVALDDGTFGPWEAFGPRFEFKLSARSGAT